MPVFVVARIELFVIEFPLSVVGSAMRLNSGTWSYLLGLVFCVVIITKKVAVQVVVVYRGRRRAGLLFVGDGRIVWKLVLRQRVGMVAHGRVVPPKAPAGAMVQRRWAMGKDREGRCVGA